MDVKLDDRNLKWVYEITERESDALHNQGDTLHNPRKAMDFLEDSIAHNNGDLALLLRDVIGNPVFSAEEQARERERVLQLTGFFTNAVLRYMQKMHGVPTQIQGLGHYNTTDGNQVDSYL